MSHDSWNRVENFRLVHALETFWSRSLRPKLPDYAVVFETVSLKAFVDYTAVPSENGIRISGWFPQVNDQEPWPRKEQPTYSADLISLLSKTECQGRVTAVCIKAGGGRAKHALHRIAHMRPLMVGRMENRMDFKHRCLHGSKFSLTRIIRNRSLEIAFFSKRTTFSFKNCSRSHW